MQVIKQHKRWALRGVCVSNVNSITWKLTAALLRNGWSHNIYVKFLLQTDFSLSLTCKANRGMAEFKHTQQIWAQNRVAASWIYKKIVNIYFGVDREKPQKWETRIIFFYFTRANNLLNSLEFSLVARLTWLWPSTISTFR